MRRILTALTILSMAAPALAETQKEREKRCAAQGEIVSQAVEMRKKFRSEAKAKTAILETIDEGMAPAVPFLVGFVYTLNRKDLKQDVPAAFIEQCNAYKP
ncbi:hypothetical protein [Marimonas lutisalis]|uniref:hypothetical protein n=1 Tax=Marimonas lutisalis TaxID=2545756 RepID=UPI0010F57718|nr:hypothetical protein [Marimonas lutisalis]